MRKASASNRRMRQVTTLGALLAVCVLVYARVDDAYAVHADVTESYTVQPGDTLFSVAYSHDATDNQWSVVNWIEQRNGVTNAGSLQPGHVLEVPVRNH